MSMFEQIAKAVIVGYVLVTIATNQPDFMLWDFQDITVCGVYTIFFTTLFIATITNNTNAITKTMETREEALTRAQDRAEVKFPDADTSEFNYRTINLEQKDRRRLYVLGFMECWDLKQTPSLTVNQIMLLLDLHRGTDTQARIGTNEADCQRLLRLGLLKQDTKFSMFEITAKGANYIDIITDKIKI